MSVDDKITPQEAAEILGVNRSRVRQFVASGELETAGMFGSTTMFSEAVVRLLKKKRDAAKRKSASKNSRKESRNGNNARRSLSKTARARN